MARNESKAAPAAKTEPGEAKGPDAPKIAPGKPSGPPEEPSEPEHPTLDAGEVLYRYYQTVHFGMDAKLPNGSPAWTAATKENFHSILAKHEALLQPSESD